MKVINAPSSEVEPRRLVGGVIITHGHLASEFLAAAEMIVGPLPHVTAASIEWHDDVDVARAELEHAIARVSQGRGVLLLTDMFGGPPTDIASNFLTLRAGSIYGGASEVQKNILAAGVLGL